MLLWHTLATYFRRKYGVRVQKIPLDAGATCPNRDGTLSARGCIFCNDSGSGSGMGLRGLDLRAQWDAWYTKYTTTDSDRLFMAYLQSFSNTYGPASRLAHLLEQVAALLVAFTEGLGKEAARRRNAEAQQDETNGTDERENKLTQIVDHRQRVVRSQRGNCGDHHHHGCTGKDSVDSLYLSFKVVGFQIMFHYAAISFSSF